MPDRRNRSAENVKYHARRPSALRAGDPAVCDRAINDCYIFVRLWGELRYRVNYLKR